MRFQVSHTHNYIFHKLSKRYKFTCINHKTIRQYFVLINAKADKSTCTNKVKNVL